MKDVREEPDYLAGALFACASLIEDMHNYLMLKEDPKYEKTYVIRERLPSFLKMPDEVWKFARRMVERWVGDEGGRYAVQLQKMRALEYRITVENLWEELGKDEALMLIGYDCTKEEYYRLLSKGKEDQDEKQKDLDVY